MAESGGRRSPEDGTEGGNDKIAKKAGDVKGVIQSIQSGLQEGEKKTDQANQKPTRGAESPQKRQLPTTPEKGGAPTGEEKKSTQQIVNKNASSVKTSGTGAFVSQAKKILETGSSSNNTQKKHEQVPKTQETPKIPRGEEAQVVSKSNLIKVKVKGETDDAADNSDVDEEDSYVKVEKSDVQNSVSDKEDAPYFVNNLKDDDSNVEDEDQENRLDGTDTSVGQEKTETQLQHIVSDVCKSAHPEAVVHADSSEHTHRSIEQKETPVQDNDTKTGISDSAPPKTVEDADYLKGIVTSGGQNKTETKDTNKEGNTTDGALSEAVVHADNLEHTDKSIEQKETETPAEHNNDRETSISHIDDAPPKTAEHVGNLEGSVTSIGQTVTETQAEENNEDLEFNENSLPETGQVGHVEGSETSSVLKENEMQPDRSCSETVNKNHVHSEGSSSSIEQLAHGPDSDKEGTEIEGGEHALLQFQMRSMTHLPENAESSQKCDKTLAFQEQHSELHSNDTRDTDKPGNSSGEAEDGNTCGPQYLKKTKPGGSEKSSMSAKNYSLKKVGNDYLLCSKSQVLVKMEVLKGEANVTLVENFILINGDTRYYFKDDEGAITVHEIEEARSIRNSRKEIKEKQQNRQFAATGYEKKEENLSTEVVKKKDSNFEERAFSPQSDELLKDPNKQSSQPADGGLDDCTEMMSKLNLRDSETNSEGPSESTQTQTDIFPGRSGSKDTTKIPKPTPRKQTHDGREPCQGQSSQPVPPPRRSRGNDKHQSLQGNELKSEGQDVHEEAETRKQEMKAENLVLQQLDVSGGLKEEERSPETESEMGSWFKDIVFKVNYRLANTSEVQEKLITRKISHLDYMKWQLVVCDSHLVKTKLKKLKPEPAYSVTNSNKITEVNLDHVKECPPFENIIDALFHHLIADTQNLVCERVDFSTDLDSEAVLREITDIQFCKDKAVYVEICEKNLCIFFICNKVLANKMKEKVSEVIQRQLAMSKIHSVSVKRPMVFLKKMQQPSFDKDWNEKFPSIKYRGNTGAKNEAIIILQGPKKDLEAAGHYIFEYPCNEISISEVKHADCLNRSTLIPLLNYKLSSISEKYEDFAYEINEQTNRIGVCSPSQETAGSVTQNLKKCIKKKSIHRKEHEEQFDNQLVETLKNGITETCKPYVEVVLGNKDAIDVYALKTHLEDCFEPLRARLDSIKEQRGDYVSLSMSTLEKVLSSEAPSFVSHTVQIDRPYVVDLICKSEMYDRFLQNSAIEITLLEQKGFHINGPRSEVEGTVHDLEQFVQNTKVVAIDLKIKRDKNSVISEVIHEIERNMQVIVKKQEKEITDQTPSEISGQKKVKWIFPQGHTVRLAQHCSVQEKKACVKLIEQNQGTVGSLIDGEFPLLVPQWQEGRAKEKWTVQDGFEKILEKCFNQSFHHVDIHICHSSWKVGLLVKQLLVPLKKVLANRKPCICVCFIGEDQQLCEEIQCACKEAFCGVGEASGFSGQKHSETRDRLSVKVVKGNLVETKADVLVNTISTNGNLEEGAVSGSILREAGNNLQVELYKHTPLKLWGIYQTSAYIQGCRNILHGCLAEYKNKGDSTQKLEDFVSACLSKAEECGAKSIAFPAIGSGGKKYPTDVVKNAMFNAVEKFGSAQRKQKTLTEVNFVIFEEEQYKLFTTEQKKRDFKGVTNSFLFGKVSVSAVNGSFIDCDKDYILYLWQKNVMHTVNLKKNAVLKEFDASSRKQWIDHRQGKDKDQLFWTTVFTGRNTNQVVHVPYGDAVRKFEDAVREGLFAVMSKKGKSVAIFLDKNHHCVQDTNFIQEILSGVLDASPSAIEHCLDVTVVVEDQAVFSQVKHFFATNSQKASIGQNSSGKDQSLATGNVLIELVGVQRDISAAVEKMRNQEGVLLVEVQCFEADVKNRAQTECEVKSDDESVSENPGITVKDLSSVETALKTSQTPHWCIENCDKFAKYVKVRNVPTHYEKETLKSEIFKEGVFPVKLPKLIHCKGSEEALLICQNDKDAAELSQCKDIKPFIFSRVQGKALGFFSSKVDKTSINYIKGVKTYKDFKKALEFAEIEIKTEDPFEIMAPTSYQYKYLMMTVDDYSHTANTTDSGVKFGAEAKQTRGLSQSYDTQIVEKVDDVNESLWDIIRCSDEYKQLEAKCKNITHNGDSVLIELLGEDVPSDEINKIKYIVTSFEGKELQEVDVHESDKETVNQWCSEINDKVGYKCCQYVCDRKKVIMFCNTYDDFFKAKHILGVKTGLIKQTGVARRSRRTVDEKESISLNTPNENVPMSPNRTKERFTFDWSTDAEQVQRYTTQENIKVLVYKADILNLPVDCIVNAANDSLSHGGGVAAVIEKAAGSSLKKEGDKRIRDGGRLPVGTAYTTTAGKLRRYGCVIHAVGPRWSDYYPHTRQKVQECEEHLYQAVYNSFLEAEKRKLKSIALPAVSSAIFGVPEKICVYQYAKAIEDYSRKAFSTSSALKEIHFIDINYSIVQKIQECFQRVFLEGNMSEYNRNKFVWEHNTGRIFSDYSKPDSSYPQTKKHHQSNADTMPSETNAMQFEPLSFFDEDKNVYTYLLDERGKQELLLKRGDMFAVKGDTVVIPIDEQGRRGNIAKVVYGKIPSYKYSEYNFKVSSEVQNKKLSEVFLTYGYDCGYQNILHVVFPAVIKGESNRQSLVRKSCNNIFNLCRESPDITSCVMTLMNTGVRSQDHLKMCAEEFLQSYLENISKTKSQKYLRIHLVCKDDNVFYVVRKVFEDYVQKTKQKSELQKEDEEVTGATGNHSVANKDQEFDNCVICMDKVTNPRTLDCGHTFCSECIEEQFTFKMACPTCGKVFGIIEGDQPEGTMKESFYKYSDCHGYRNCGQIAITYYFPSGTQGPNHPNPGKWYRGITRTAYLPGNEEGRKILAMLKIAFERKLVFTIGRSRTTGEEGVITWNDIHHKTDPRPHSQFGYPDPGYLDRVKDELKAKGITENDIPKSSLPFY